MAHKVLDFKVVGYFIPYRFYSLIKILSCSLEDEGFLKPSIIL
jgi:hypothetical protein